MMNISKRLKAVADMVSDYRIAADIGTDHAYIPIYLAKEKGFKKIFATDIRKGPLERAHVNILRYGVSDKVELRLSDGLSAIKENETESIIISGMGGLLINHILKEGLDVARSAKELVLSPHSDISLVRMFLKNNGFRIVDEDCVYDEGKYYFILKSVTGTMEFEDELEKEYGRILFEKRCRDFQQYLFHELEKRNSILEHMQCSDREGKKLEIINQIILIKKGLEKMGQYESL